MTTQVITASSLSDEQNAALELMLAGENIFLTGEAGTGKSTLLREFRKRCDAKHTVFLAPTGIAASNIAGQTIHSFCRLKPGLQSPDTIDEIGNSRYRTLLNAVQTIVIYEISMVRADVFYAIDHRFREAAIGCNRMRPFAGKHVIVCGDFFQLPPVKSAVKRELRTRNIYYSTIYEIEGRDVLFRIGCEAGTYVRTYCHNIGEALGVGAHMAELRRTQVGSFREKNNLVTLQDVADAYHFWIEDGDESFLRDAIMPMERAADYLPKIVIKDSAVDAICHGADLACGGIAKLADNIQKNDLVAIETLKGELVASGNSLLTSNEILDADSGFAVNTSKVFMKPDTYPRFWK